MARPSHPQAMAPCRPGPTRTAPPHMPGVWPMGRRYRSYVFFGAGSFFFLLMGLLVLRTVWALGTGPAAWAELQREFAHPAYVIFHVLALGVFVWSGWRFLIKLFAKAQPPMIGPIRRPPEAIFPPLLGAAWVGATVVLLAVLWGVVL